MGEDGHSRKGFFGQTIHYDSHGHKTGKAFAVFSAAPTITAPVAVRTTRIFPTIMI